MTSIKSLERSYNQPEFNEIYQEIERLIEKAEEYYKINLRIPLIDLSLKGRVAGRAYYKINLIKLNLGLYKANKEYFHEKIIPHEVSHIVSCIYYGDKGIGHNKYFKSVMEDCYNVPYFRLHTMLNVNKASENKT